MAASRAALVLAALAACSLWAGPVLAQACPPAGTYVPRKTVTFSVNGVDPVYSSEDSRARLSVLAGQTAGSGVSNNGLTRTSAGLDISLKAWSVDLGQGRICMGLERVEATWRMSEIKVGIAREYPPGSCQYRAIRAHEDEHVAIGREAFRRWAPVAESALRAVADRLSPRIATGNGAKELAEYKEQLAAAVKPAFNNFSEEQRSRNAAIDTRASYQRVYAQCSQW